jgi:hypothetical protein
MNDLITIPEIPNPLGKEWIQPKTSEILVDNNFAVMTENTFHELLKYTLDESTELYVGKMWKSYIPKEDKYLLTWCYKSDKKIYFEHREILILK